ncbi:MAG: hypothetical protein LBH20_09310 [Treponema sp.]|jgi:hypothetical protein|nr:hypothetical protein [Treponema sp.]
MMPEIKQAPQCAEQRRGPTEEADNQNINPHTEKSKPLTWNDYELFKANRYIRGGISGAMARHFAQGRPPPYGPVGIGHTASKPLTIPNRQ